MEPFKGEFSCIIVDDGSTDNTKQILRELHKNYAWLRSISNPENQGKSIAFSTGLKEANDTFVMLLDADLQNVPDDLLVMLETLQLNNLDMMVGWRKNRKDSLVKKLLSAFYNRLLNMLFNMKLHDHNAGIKIIKREIFDNVELRGDWHRYLSVLAHHAGYKVGELPVTHRNRMHGKSRYGLNRYIKFFYDLPSLYKQINLLRLKNQGKR